MIIQVFIFALLFLVLGIIFILKKKKLLGWMFILLFIFALAIGSIVVGLYPHLWPL
ncbi:MAG: hypothetical protein K9G67_07060 [Bacteroidales bacterium]|nr:hypothetical protein [Bacteroidales bacterium]MCF8343132.1 hypothetical protein [Bacteroidales bacterium]MCF8351270.1 hypothetical protein [Bacteroidales bacterium]MCF8376100.1 hypothetical protein [Bacteroidales bacterium]MCF8400367.1 hypothetical protein [Bacteroidales bacterium]